MCVCGSCVCVCACVGGCVHRREKVCVCVSLSASEEMGALLF